MFDNSIAVLSRTIRKLAKLFSLVELFIQLLFIGYYVYLVVNNLNSTLLLTSYSIILGLSVLVFILMIVTFDIDDKKGKFIKKKIKQLLKYFSWAVKAIVITYNIFMLTQGKLTNVGNFLLIISIVVLIFEISFSVILSFLARYLNLTLYALKVDYQNLIGKDEDISSKPIGRIISNANLNNDFATEVDELNLQYEIYLATKSFVDRYPKKRKFRRKYEKKLNRYCFKSISYFNNHHPLRELYNRLCELVPNDSSYPYFYVLKFFLINEIEDIYIGPKSIYMQLIIAALLSYVDEKNFDFIEMVYFEVIKRLLDDHDYRKVQLGASVVSLTNSMAITAFKIIDNDQAQFEIEPDLTVGKEISHILTKKVKEKISGSIKNKARRFFQIKK